nr:hypothetical protein [uncultured bacterium]
MARFLVVAYQTATSPELVRRLSELAEADPEPTYVTLLVPAREEHPGSEAQARGHADAAARILERNAGVHVSWSVIGDAHPMRAIEEELRALDGEYDAIVLSTLPPGTSRWLELANPEEAARTLGIPVHHVVAQPVA